MQICEFCTLKQHWKVRLVVLKGGFLVLIMRVSDSVDIHPLHTQLTD